MSFFHLIIGAFLLVGICCLLFINLQNLSVIIRQVLSLGKNIWLLSWKEHGAFVFVTMPVRYLPCLDAFYKGAVSIELINTVSVSALYR